MSFSNAVRFANYYTDSGAFPLEWHMYQYAGRALGRVAMDVALLDFLVHVLSRQDCIAALRHMRRVPARLLRPGCAKLPALPDPIDEMEASDFDRALRGCLSRCREDQGEVRLETFLKKRIRQSGAKLLRRGQWSGYDRMADVRSVFRLSEDDISFLTVVLCYSISSALENFCDSTHVQRKRELISVLTGLPLERLARVSDRTGRLVQTGIVQVPDPWRHSSFYSITQGVRDHLLGMGDASLLLKYVQATPPAQYTPDRFGLPEDAVHMLQGLLRAPKPCNILLHGVPGTGKTEFAKAVARTCGKPVFFVAHAMEADRQNGRVAVEAVSAMHLADKAVVVVDEADELLNLRPAPFDPPGGPSKNGMNGKSWLNEFLDRSRAQIIWITNKIAAIDASSMRRFDYDIPFRRQSARRRQEIWQEHLRQSPLQPLVTPADVAEMARKFRVGAAGIANAVSNAARVVPADTADRDVVLSTLRNLLTSHERLTGGDAEGKLAGLPAHYDPIAISTDVPAVGVVAALKAVVAGRRAERPAANLLFWGPPGTGKTAFAQYLAECLDKELLIRRASDLLSMFVGGTEHNIREAFEEAGQEDAILLLDEADSFFIDRTRAQRSWETSQTNELLTQMENHHGILICCTNLLDSLDHAVLRRFAWKVRFQAPTPEGRLRIYRRYFDTMENPVPAECLARVARMENLTPGDMKAVWVRFRFRPAAEWNHAEIVHALAEEVTYRGERSASMGFHGYPCTPRAADKA